MFLWEPRSSGQSRDLVTGSPSSPQLTEGTPVSFGGRDGRSYSGTVGSRFGSPISNTVSPNELTMFSVVRLTGTGLTLYPLTLSDAAVGNQWIWTRVSTAISPNLTEFSYRLNNQGAGGNYIVASPSAIADTAMHTVAIRLSDGGSGLVIVDSFVDSPTPAATNSGTPTQLTGMSNATIGRTEDSSPGDSNGGQVFGAGLWRRALDALEMAALMADPFGYL